MATDWIVPTTADVVKYLTKAGIDASNFQNDFAGSKRLEGPTGILAGSVAKVRGAIWSGRKVRLSATAGSVPPEAVEHVLVMCVPALAAGMGSPLATFIQSDFYKDMLTEARDFLKLCREGLEVQGPTDPTTGGGGPLATVVASGGDRLTRDNTEGL